LSARFALGKDGSDMKRIPCEMKDRALIGLRWLIEACVVVVSSVVGYEVGRRLPYFWRGGSRKKG
jgi:hypothetical protein